MESPIWFLDLMNMYPDETARFYPSEVILTNHSDAYYLSDPKHVSDLEAVYIW